LKSTIRQRAGAAARAGRRGQGHTLASLAEQARLSPELLSRLERGQTGSLEAFARVAQALGVPLSRLLEGPGAVDRYGAAPGLPPSALRVARLIANADRRLAAMVEAVVRCLLRTARAPEFATAMADARPKGGF
jgi:transcriptional regulator with XRE-family HTH domain